MVRISSTLLSLSMVLISLMLVISYYISAFSDEALFNSSAVEILPLGPYYYLNEMAGTDVLYILLFILAAAASLFCDSTRWMAVVHTLLIIVVATYQVPICLTIVCFWAKLLSIGDQEKLDVDTIEHSYVAANVIRLIACLTGMILSIVALSKWWKETIIYRFGPRRAFHLTVTILGGIVAFIYLIPVITAHYMMTYGDLACRFNGFRSQQILDYVASDATYKFGPVYFNVVVAGLGAIGYIFDVSDRETQPLYRAYLFSVLFGNLSLMLLEQISKITAYTLIIDKQQLGDCMLTCLKVAAGCHGAVICGVILISALLIGQMVV